MPKLHAVPQCARPCDRPDLWPPWDQIPRPTMLPDRANPQPQPYLSPWIQACRDVLSLRLNLRSRGRLPPHDSMPRARLGAQHQSSDAAVELQASKHEPRIGYARAPLFLLYGMKRQTT